MSTIDTAAIDTASDTSLPYNVPGLERGLRVLAAFSDAEPVLDAAELSRRLGIPRTTMFRLLQTLEHLGYLEREATGRGYRLDIGVLRLGFGHLSGLDLTDLALPLLEALRDDTGFTAHLLIRDGRDVVFVAKAHSYLPGLGSVKIQVGSRLPAHATTHGHLLMSGLSLGELDALYPEPQLQRYTQQTPATVRALYERIQADAAQGFAVGESSFEPGISVVSAPVRDQDSQVVAAVAITVPYPTIAPHLVADGLIKRVCHSAHELSMRLNYRPGRAAARADTITQQRIR
jgi:DNA-binding IclR family transcriptional regulator